MSDFRQLKSDPLEATEIMDLLGASYIDLDDPKRSGKLEDIIDYFSGRDDKRSKILKIISKNPSNALEVVWMWVQLTKERSNKIKSLNKEDFNENIQKEIENEYITKENISLLKEQISSRIKSETEKQSLAKERIRKEKEGIKIDKLEKDVIEESFNVSKLQDIKRTIDEIESINNVINQ